MRGIELLPRGVSVDFNKSSTRGGGGTPGVLGVGGAERDEFLSPDPIRRIAADIIIEVVALVVESCCGWIVVCVCICCWCCVFFANLILEKFCSFSDWMFVLLWGKNAGRSKDFVSKIGSDKPGVAVEDSVSSPMTSSSKCGLASIMAAMASISAKRALWLTLITVPISEAVDDTYEPTSDPFPSSSNELSRSASSDVRLSVSTGASLFPWLSMLPSFQCQKKIKKNQI